MPAQSLIKEGPVLELPKGSNVSRVIGGDDKVFYCLLVKGKGEEYYLERYAVNSLTKEQSVLLPSEKKDIYIKEFFDGEKVFLFRTNRNKDDNSLSLYADIVKKDGSILKKGILVKNILIRDSDYSEVPDYFHFAISPDKKSIAIVTIDYNPPRRTSKNVDVFVYNTHNFTIKQEIDITETYGNNVNIDNVGNLFYLRGSDIVILPNATGKPERYTLIEKEQSLLSARFQIDGDNVIVAGFYRIEGPSYGVFTKAINIITKTTSADYKQFPENLNKMLYYSNPLPDRKDYQLSAIELKKADNSFYLLGEELAKVFYYTTSSYGTTADKTQYNYFNTIVVKITGDKKIDWIKPIPKAIFISNSYNVNTPHFLSYVLNGELKLVHLQHPLNKDLNIDNYDITQVKNIVGAGGCDAVQYSFDATGSVKSQLLIEKIDNGFFIQPCAANDKYLIDNVFYSNKNTNIIFFNKGKNSKFAFIE